MQLKHEGVFEDGVEWGVFAILPDIRLDSSQGKVEHSIKYFMRAYNNCNKATDKLMII